MKQHPHAIFGAVIAGATIAVALAAVHRNEPVAHAAAADQAVPAVQRAVLDYVDAIYQARPELIHRSVSPALVKEGYAWSADAGAYQVLPMNFEELVDIARRFSKEREIPADAPRHVEVFDVLDKTAAAKLTALWGVDYLHLMKQDGRWLITQVLWQTPPP